MCEGNSDCLGTIEEEMNKIFKDNKMEKCVSGNVCKIMGRVRPEDLGARFIENFKNWWVFVKTMLWMHCMFLISPHEYIL